MRKSVEERFWSKVDIRGPDECWEWKASINSRGYGQFRVGDGTIKAHRVAWELTNGPIPRGEGPHGTCVCHRCDNKRCCNPAHLFLGTNADNMADRNSKGRQARGEEHGRAKLRPDLVRWARRAVAEGYTQIEVAKALGVSQVNISKIVRRKKWAHIE